MPLPAAVLVLAALVAVATVGGLVLRGRTGRARPVRPADALAAGDLGVDGDLGRRATLVQLSTTACAVCPATARLLRAVADTHPGVRHVEVDLERRPDVAHRFGVLQTPTTLLVDADGRLRARIGGAPRPAEVETALQTLTGGPRG